jgi:hypothetical protein
MVTIRGHSMTPSHNIQSKKLQRTQHPWQQQFQSIRIYIYLQHYWAITNSVDIQQIDSHQHHHHHSKKLNSIRTQPQFLSSKWNPTSTRPIGRCNRFQKKVVRSIFAHKKKRLGNFSVGFLSPLHKFPSLSLSGFL